VSDVILSNSSHQSSVSFLGQYSYYHGRFSLLGGGTNRVFRKVQVERFCFMHESVDVASGNVGCANGKEVLVSKIDSFAPMYPLRIWINASEYKWFPPQPRGGESDGAYTAVVFMQRRA
jgi:hypothetical protein